MPASYRTNSPYILDYLASVKTRQDIVNDPSLCQLLEDPYIKDNMEIALKQSEANKGGYDEKKEFVECLLANGPELDPHTILHYRDIILSDSSYSSIVEELQFDIEHIDYVREYVYNKSSDDSNCWKQPCNYLGKFSGDLLLPIDYKNYGSISNFWSKMFRDIFEDDKKSDKTIDNGKPVQNNIVNLNDDNSISDYKNYFLGPLYVDMLNKLHPNVANGYSLLRTITAEKTAQLAEEFKSIKPLLSKKHSGASGDSNAIPRQEKYSANALANIYSKLGDCYRLVKHMRTLNSLDKKTNQNMTTVAPIAQKDATGRVVDSKYTEATVLSPRIVASLDIIGSNLSIEEKERRYETLKNKTTLTLEEQSELNRLESELKSANIDTAISESQTLGTGNTEVADTTIIPDWILSDDKTVSDVPDIAADAYVTN